MVSGLGASRARPVRRGGERDSGNLRCPYCHDDTWAEPVVHCLSCGASHHQACWQESPHCSATACRSRLAGTRPVGTLAAVAVRSGGASRPRRRWRASPPVRVSALIGLQCAIVGLGLWAAAAPRSTEASDMSRRATALEFGLAETSSCRGRLLRHFVRPRAGRGDVDALELYDAMEKTRLTLEYGARAARSPELKADLRRALDQLEADKTWLRDFGLRHSLPGFGERFLRSS